jgi:hypothetical protein
MLRICGGHACDGEPGKAAWVVFRKHPWDQGDLVRLSDANAGSAVLSYWIYQEAGPSGCGRVLVDLITADGRVLSDYGTEGFCDQYGNPFDAALVSYPLGIWTHFCVRLDRWALDNTVIDSIVVRYKEPAAGDGAVVAYLDDLYVGGWRGAADTMDGDLVLNGDFSKDADTDNQPDFWTGPYPDLNDPPGGLLWCEDGNVLLLDSDIVAPASITQIMPRGCHDGCFVVTVSAKGWPDEEDDRLAVRLRDLDAGGSVLDERVLEVSSEWRDHGLSLHTDTADHCLLLELEGVSGSVALGHVCARRCGGTDVPADEPPKIPSDRGAVAFRVGPSPSPGWVTVRIDGLPSVERAPADSTPVVTLPRFGSVPAPHQGG